jgi:UDPglucose 6-dehydrogenase
MVFRLTVLGTGYLGTAQAACLASLGFDVLGVDTDPRRIHALGGGIVPFHEPGLEPLLQAGLRTGRLSFTTDYARAAEFGDVHFICVGTPQAPGSYRADLTQVENCVGTLAPLLERRCLVVGKCTVPVGTAKILSERLSLLAPAAELAWCPEFLREGNAVNDTLRPDRIVAGVQSARAEAILREIHAEPVAAGAPFLVTDLVTAELVKVAANAFLATKISFINAMAEVCEAAHGDVHLLAQALGHDQRIGPAGLRPGLGFGGGCLPKDIRAFMARADELGVDQALSFLREVDAINMRRRARMVDLAREMASPEGFDGAKVGVLGVAFKPDSDDIRDSPALDVAKTIHDLGATVTVYDPVAMLAARRAHPELRYAESALDAVQDADVVLLLTEWAEFRNADPDVLGKVVAQRNIVDGRNALDPARWRAASWQYRALGRPLRPARHAHVVYLDLVGAGPVSRQRGEPEQHIAGPHRPGELEPDGASGVRGAGDLRQADRRGRVTGPDLQVRAGDAAERDVHAVHRHRLAHVDQQAGARLQVAEPRRGVPVGPPVRRHAGVDREFRLGGAVAVRGPARAERRRADRLDGPRRGRGWARGRAGRRGRRGGRLAAGRAGHGGGALGRRRLARAARLGHLVAGEPEYREDNRAQGRGRLDRAPLSSARGKEGLRRSVTITDHGEDPSPQRGLSLYARYAH